MICFEHIVLSFKKLIEWTGTRKQDKIFMRENILAAIRGHKIAIEQIDDVRTRNYLMGFKHYSTERVIKSITYELTENDAWSVKGRETGNCWHHDCCIFQNSGKARCNVTKGMSGNEKITGFLTDLATQSIVEVIQRMV